MAAIGQHTLAGITVIVPALNEEPVIASVVGSIVHQVKGHFGDDYEVILVNDGSSDRTGEIMAGFAADSRKIRVLHNNPNIGLGPSYMRGLEEAKHEYVMMLCGDGGLPADSLPAIFAEVGKADIVIPYIVNLRSLKPPLRYWLSEAYTGLFNLIFRNRLRYYNGLPIHRLDLIRQIPIRAMGFSFQAGFLTAALAARCTYIEVGVDGFGNPRGSTAMSRRNLWATFLTLWELIITVRKIHSGQIVIERTDSRATASAMGEKAAELSEISATPVETVEVGEGTEVVPGFATRAQKATVE